MGRCLRKYGQDYLGEWNKATNKKLSLGMPLATPGIQKIDEDIYQKGDHANLCM